MALFFAAFVAALALADEEVVIPVDEAEEEEEVPPVEMETNFIPELPTSEEMSETPTTEPQSSSWHSRKYQRKHSLLAQRLDRSLGDPVGEKWFEQVSILSPFPIHWILAYIFFFQDLDHFHPTDGHTWKQRYFVNASLHRRGGPVFLMIGGEGEANSAWMSHGTWMDYAKEFGALCFQLEHRWKCWNLQS